eukprot:CAMPEP_0170554128 /NCGR_PEP_ID=MMETSP0211-20121228/12009_1 /TAXON_ID=311385 /ORGANISM="Pseudokeronopsis sp., Strain OXSARD2" /LENGTH=123 /DNA_ID=CAMNT_0010863001 /DNA_START=301 /DNA_END=672 /DNA_ORIENTATION=+
MIITPFPSKWEDVSKKKDDIISEDLNKLWLIIRYMTIDGKNNKHYLSGGETIKLGRVRFIIKEINCGEDENKTEDGSILNLDDLEDNENDLTNNQNILSPEPHPERLFEEAKEDVQFYEGFEA